MRYSNIIAGFFAAGVLATPVIEKRAYVTKVDAIVTVYETVTAGAAPASTPCSTKNAAVQNPHRGDRYHGYRKPHRYGGWHHHKPGNRKPHYRPKPKPQPNYGPAPTPASKYYGAKPTPISGGNARDYEGICVEQHNMHRRNHSAPDVEWDAGLAATAAKIASSCNYAHNTAEDGGGYGQNIAAGPKPEEVGKIITNLFYNNEYKLYNSFGSEPDMGNFHGWGHLTQIIWKATTKIGCATHHCPSGLAGAGANVPPYFTVCNYKTPGNVGGGYGENVLPSLGQPLYIYGSDN